MSASAATAGFLAYLEQKRIETIRKIFIDRNATSPSTAITTNGGVLVNNELEKVVLDNKTLQKYSFVQKTDSGKYYFSEDLYNSFLKQQQLVIRLFFLALILLFLVTFFLM